MCIMYTNKKNWAKAQKYSEKNTKKKTEKYINRKKKNNL